METVEATIYIREPFDANTYDVTGEAALRLALSPDAIFGEFVELANRQSFPTEFVSLAAISSSAVAAPGDNGEAGGFGFGEGGSMFVGYNNAFVAEWWSM
jgi:hypothetical protein